MKVLRGRFRSLMLMSHSLYNIIHDLRRTRVYENTKFGWTPTEWPVV